MDHVPYEEALHHPHDFVVRYRFFSPDEGGRLYPPAQGLRCDFRYADPELDGGRTWMIWPEFEDEAGQVIRNRSVPIPRSGTARMWIINPAWRTLHQGRLRVGTKAYFTEGVPTAECEVIDLIGLMSNPTAETS